MSVSAFGFEEGVFGPRWTTTHPAVAFTASSPISGLRSLHVNPSNQSNAHAISVQSFGVGLIVVRFNVRFTTLPNAQCLLLSMEGDANHIGTGVWLSGADRIQAITASGGSGEVGVSAVTGVQYNIDVKIDKRANPWTVDVQVNGVPCSQALNPVAASTTAVQLRLGLTGSALTADARFDDVVVSTTEADYPIGPGYIDPYTVISDGAHNIAGTGDFQRGNSGTDITNAIDTAFQLIDDIPLPSGAVDEADNIRAVAPPNATDYTEHVFGPAPGISAPTVAPRAVEVILAHHQVATQSGQMVVELNDNGTIDTVFDTGAAAGVVTYRYANKHYAAGPAGPWVIGGGGNGDFTDLRCRFRTPDAIPDQCLDAIMIEAEFRGPLLTKQTLADGTDITVAEDLVADPPTSYELSDNITETVDSVVRTTVFNETAEGEVPQQQCVLESNGGEDVGTTFVNPGQHVFARVQVTGADTAVGLSGVANP